MPTELTLHPLYPVMPTFPRVPLAYPPCINVVPVFEKTRPPTVFPPPLAVRMSCGPSVSKSRSACRSCRYPSDPVRACDPITHAFAVPSCSLSMGCSDSKHCKHGHEARTENQTKKWRCFHVVVSGWFGGLVVIRRIPGTAGDSLG